MFYPHIYLKLLASTLLLLALGQQRLIAAEEHGNGGGVVQTIYMGVPGNRYPYSYIDNENNLHGVLLDKTVEICKKAGFKCNFTYGNFHDNLKKLHDFKIDAALIVDSVVLPDYDEVRLTNPLCKHNAIFIKKANSRSEKEITDLDLQNALIGVPYGSLFHLYALEHFYSFSSVKPYETLEAGIFDVFSERIDVLFTEEAIFDSRIASTFLSSGHKHNTHWLEKLHNQSVELSGKLMTIAVRNTSDRDDDDQLMAKLSAAVTEKDSASPCTNLIKTKHVDNDKSSTEQ
ncbi:MAG: substrate-binding periplasmic protein [Thiolinea sp.]